MYTKDMYCSDKINYCIFYLLKDFGFCLDYLLKTLIFIQCRDKKREHIVRNIKQSEKRAYYEVEFGLFQDFGSFE